MDKQPVLKLPGGQEHARSLELLQTGPHISVTRGGATDCVPTATTASSLPRQQTKTPCDLVAVGGGENIQTFGYRHSQHHRAFLLACKTPTDFG